MIPFDRVWHRLTLFDCNKPFLTVFDTVWPHKTPFDPVDPGWPQLTPVDPVWSGLTLLDPVWPHLTLFDPIWHYDHVLPCFTQFDPVWSRLTRGIFVSWHIVSGKVSWGIGSQGKVSSGALTIRGIVSPWAYGLPGHIFQRGILSMRALCFGA